MVRKSRISPRLFSDFNTFQFAAVMGTVVFAVLLIFMMVPPGHHGVSADLPKVSHPIPMPGALREDAMMVSILRDGKVYFGNDQINVINLPAKIQDHLKDREVERKVYIVADTRARWSNVERVLEGVHSAGVIRVAFLAERGAPILQR